MDVRVPLVGARSIRQAAHSLWRRRIRFVDVRQPPHKKGSPVIASGGETAVARERDAISLAVDRQPPHFAPRSQIPQSREAVRMTCQQPSAVGADGAAAQVVAVERPSQVEGGSISETCHVAVATSWLLDCGCNGKIILRNEANAAAVDWRDVMDDVPDRRS